MASTVEQFKKTFFDRSAVDKALDRALRRTMSRFGAFVRQRSRSSIRTRKATSQPGTPPTNRTGLLKKMIFFGYEPQAQTVVIGPAALRANPTAPHLLEYGGSRQGNGEVIYITRDPGRDASGRFVSKGRQKIRLTGAISYKPRPYMKPAYDAELPKFLDSLKDSM
jgi:hypothetical protein